MKRFKFRAWDKENNYMVGVDFLGEDVIKISNGEWENVEFFEIMQYTGLDDDFGTEIYAEDIVEIQDKIETKTPYTSPVYSINGSFYVDPHPAHKQIGLGNKRLLSEYIDTGVGYQFHLSCKVVGNVYENKELLCKEVK